MSDISIERELRELRREVRELKEAERRRPGRAPVETGEEFVGRHQRARERGGAMDRDPLGDALRSAGGRQEREEEEAAKAIRSVGGKPGDYGVGQFKAALRKLDWPSQHFQTRLEGAAQRGL